MTCNLFASPMPQFAMICAYGLILLACYWSAIPCCRNMRCRGIVGKGRGPARQHGRSGPSSERETVVFHFEHFQMRILQSSFFMDNCHHGMRSSNSDRLHCILCWCLESFKRNDRRTNQVSLHIAMYTAAHFSNLEHCRPWFWEAYHRTFHFSEWMW